MATERIRELSVNTILFAISSFGSRIISFLLLPLYTSALSTSDYGTVDLITSTVSLLIPVLTLNIQDAVLRFGLSKDAKSEEILSVGLKTIAGGACILFVMLTVFFILNIVPIDKAYLAFLFVMFLLGALNNVLTMYLKSLDRIKILVVSGISGTFVTCILSIALLVFFPIGVLGYMSAMAIGSFFSVCILFFAGNIKLSSIHRSRSALFKAMIIYSAPLIANSMAWWINDLGDRYVVTLICGAAANGIYAVAFKIPSILSTLQTIFYNAWSISAIKEFDKNDSDGFLGRMYSLYSCAMCLACSSIMLLDIPLAEILYADEFFEAWRLVPFLLVGVFLNGLALFEGCIYAAARRTKEVSYTTLIGATISIASCIVLTLAVGPIGAAIATLLGYLATWGIRTRIMIKNIAKIRVSWISEIISLTILIIQAILAVQWETQALQLVAVVALLFVHRQTIKKIAMLLLAKLRAL